MKKERLAAKTFASMVVIGLSKVLGFLRTAIFAAIYGATIHTDAFFMAANIFGLANGVLGSLASVVVPMRTSQLHENGEENADISCSILLNLSMIISIFMGIALYLFAPLLVRLFAPYYDGEAYIVTIRICRIFTPVTILLSYIHFATGILNTHKKFAWASVVGIALNIGWITIPLLLSRMYGIYALVYGYLLGHLFQVIALIPGLRGIYKYKCVLDFRNKAVIHALAMCLPIFIGTLSLTINQTIDKALASTLAEGSVTALGYAAQLISLTGTIISAPISTTFFTEASHAVHEKDMRSLRHNISQFSTVITLILFPVSLLFVLLDIEIVTIVFVRGEFSHEAAILTRNAFLFYVPSILPQAIGLLLTRCYYSFGDTKLPLYIGLGGVALNITLNFALIGPMGIGGLTLATSISAIFITVLLAAVIKKHTGKLRILDWLKSCWRIALAGAGLSIAVILTKALHIESHFIRFMVCATAGTAVYLAILVLVKQNETCRLLRTVFSKARNICGVNRDRNY